jgi:hypothetical protein
MDEKERLIQQIKEIAIQMNSTKVPRNEFFKRSGVSERTILKLFSSYNEFVQAAGLVPHVFPKSDNPTYSDKELLNEVMRVIRLSDSKMTRIFFEQNAQNFSTSVLERRFGGWINTLRTVKNLLDSNSDKELIQKINEYTEDVIVPVLAKQDRNQNAKPVATGIEVDSNEASHETPPVGLENDSIEASHKLLPVDTSSIYGDFINFRGLQHAPVNEQGVVFLFGMICQEIGYVVEIVKTGFPDCEAKRQIRGKPGMWQRVRIEFEYKSRNFKVHGHDPDQCDIIVCWEDNWPDCPIEILEISSTLPKLSSNIK